MSFAQNFALGQKIAKGLVDTYDAARQRKEFEDIQNAKPTYSEGFTAQDGDQLRAIASAKKQDGTNYYNVSANEDGTYRVTPNFQVQNDAGQMVDAAPVGVGMRRVADFMGGRYDAEQLTDSRLEGLRARAMADVIARTDPIRGIGLKQSIKASERDDTRFDWEKADRPLKVRGMELQVSNAERNERQGVRTEGVQDVIDSTMKRPMAELEPQLGRLNTNNSPYPLLYTGKDKNGYTFLKTDSDGNPTGQLKLTEPQVRQLAAAQALSEGGFGAEALNYLTTANKDIAEMVKGLNAQAATVSTSQNQALRYGNADANDAARLKLAQADADRRKLYTDFQMNRARAQDARERAALDYQGKIDGVLEGYQAATSLLANSKDPEEKKRLQNAAAIYAREYDQLRATAPKGLRVPSLPSLVAAQKPQGSGLKKLDEAGVRYGDGSGQVVLSDGRGGFIAEGGVLPDARTGFLKKAGVPDNLIGQLPWSSDGTAVGFRGREYNVNDPKDMRALVSDYSRLGANDAAVEEAQRDTPGSRRSLAFGPRLTNLPNPDAPSIYAGEEAWRRYRERQAAGLARQGLYDY